MKALMSMFVALLLLSGQTWGDVQRGNGTAPRVLLPVVKVLFPPCADEDDTADWCVWDDGDGFPFVSADGATILFR